MKKNVLFICQGNMVRSQIAEALFRKYRDGDVRSAGILPQAEQRDGKVLKDLSVDDWIRTLQEREGIDISGNICKQVTEQMVGDADTVVVMADRRIWPEFVRERKDAISWSDVSDDGTDIPKTIEQLKSLVIGLGQQHKGA